MLSALVLGLGKIGMGYDLGLDPNVYALTHARAFQQHPDFQLAGGLIRVWIGAGYLRSITVCQHMRMSSLQ